MIDVILSVKNGEPYIRESVRSILHQSCKDFVLYIIDDNSTDHTVKIIRSINDKRIRLIVNSQTQGLTKNLNKLIQMGKNQFIARQDADDISRRDRFDKQLNFLIINNLFLVGSAASIIDFDGKRIGEKTYSGKNLKTDLIRSNIFPHSSWFARRKIFEDLKGYDEKFKYAQDYDFLLRAMRNHRIGLCPEKLIDLRWDKNSLSLKHLKEQQKFALIARLNAISRADYSKLNYLYLIKPLISYLVPSLLNKIIYKLIY